MPRSPRKRQQCIYVEGRFDPIGQFIQRNFDTVFVVERAVPAAAQSLEPTRTETIARKHTVKLGADQTSARRDRTIKSAVFQAREGILQRRPL